MKSSALFMARPRFVCCMTCHVVQTCRHGSDASETFLTQVQATANRCELLSECAKLALGIGVLKDKPGYLPALQL